MQNRTAPPPAQNMTPQQYYITLYQQGYTPQEAFNAVQSSFGPPPTAQERAEQAAQQQQQSALAATGGSLAGLGAIYGVGQLLGSGASGAGAGTLGGLTATGVQGAMESAGMIGSGAAAGAGTGAGATAGTGTTVGTGTTTGGTTLSGVAGVALPIAVGAGIISNAWETGMKDILRGRGTREDWINQGFNLTPPGFIANTALRLLGKRSLGAMMTSGKSQAQQIRDDFRGQLKNTGVADDQYQVTLADGSKFDIGLDGKTRYQNVGENIDGKKTRQAWDIDFSNPLAKFATEQLDPMIQRIYEGVDRKKVPTEQFTGMLVNAVTSNANSNEDVLANIKSVLGKSTFAQQAGISAGVEPGPTQTITRPKPGEVMRVSPGMYMNDQGQIRPATTVRQALEMNYGKKKEDKEL